ncbi:MAG: PepSY domain-containing protein [Pseudomonadota bacterium]
MKAKRLLQLAHRWLGLILGAQVLLWMMSGVIMSWFHISLVRGETNTALTFSPELEARSYAAPGGAIAQMEGVTEVTLRTFLGKPVYEVKAQNGIALFSARTGAKISPITEKQVREVAKTDYVGEAQIGAVKRLTNPPAEYRGSTPVWQVTYEDRLQTRLYISPQTGKVEARRNRIWRLYDFFWMLHIMDYDERDNFNNLLLRAASATGLLFALSGLGLVIVRLRSGRYLPGANVSASMRDAEKKPAS